jgi:Zn-dependent protease
MDIYSIIYKAAFAIPAFLVALSFHEFAHAGAAYLLGDNTAKRMGRLSLNPLVHIDPVGLLCLIIFRIGWARPVMFNYHNFRRPKIYSLLTAYAGPVSNFLLAIFAMVFAKFFPFSLLPHVIAHYFAMFIIAVAQINVMLGVFNLLPIPPLDGSHILTVTFLYKYPQILRWMYQYSLLALFAIFIFIPQSQEYLWRMIEAVYTLFYNLVF